jgi:multiple sugar transport system permease protein
LAIALLIQSGSGLRSLYRTIYFLPVMATLIAMAIVWGFMLDPRIGAVNFGLKALGFKPLDFLNDRKLVLYTLCGIGIWQSVGFNMVLFMAGLTAIPSELYEAAAIDGASAWQRFRFVTLPNLRYLLVVASTLDVINTVRHYDIIGVMTGGGPAGATEVLPALLFNTAFRANRFGEAAAIGVVLLVLVLAFALVYIALTRPGRAAEER